MKKLNLIFALITLFCQILAFIGIFVSETNDQLMCSLFSFLGFGTLCGIILILDAKKVDENLVVSN